MAGNGHCRTPPSGRISRARSGTEAPTDVAGFEVRRCPTFNLFVGIRITATDPKEAAALLAQFRAYPYAQRGNPPAPKIVGPQGKAWSGMPPRGMEYWQRLNDVIQREPIDERDHFFHAMLKPLASKRESRSSRMRGRPRSSPKPLW